MTRGASPGAIADMGGRRRNFRAGVTPDEFVAAVMKGLEADAAEVGYGFSADVMRASRDELDRRFQQMNARR